MREIEFRAWHKKYKYIERVADISFNRGVVNLNGADISKIEDVELMQYTGLKDKNGVKIFEGDIVNNGESGNLIVLWSDKYQSFIINEKTGYVFNEEIDDRLCDCDDIEEYEPFEYKCVSYEVIGNIYENPELLGEQQ